MGKLIEQIEATTPNLLFTGSDTYDIMFSDSTRGDISLSELGSGEGSGDDNFTMFDTSLFTGSTIDIGSTVVKENESSVSGITTEGKTGTTEFETDVNESSDITEGTDVTLEGSGTSFEGSGASTDEFTQETQVSVSEYDSMFLILYRIILYYIIDISIFSKLIY